MTQLLHALKMTLIDAQIFVLEITNQNLILTLMMLKQIWKSIMQDDGLPVLSVINTMKLADALKDKQMLYNLIPLYLAKKQAIVQIFKGD